MGSKTSGTPKAALIKLNGTQIDKDGKESHSDFFQFLQLPEDHKANLEKTLTPQQALTFRNHIVRMRVGVSAAIPKICGGPKCHDKQCPFHSEKNWPLTIPCPIEESLIINWTKSYVEDLGVDPDSRTEMILVNKLVECDIIDYRANIGLATDENAQRLMKVDIIDDGEKISEITNIHPLLDAKSKNHKSRLEILESLAATRKEKYKRAAALKKREEESIGDHLANLKKALGAASARTATTPSIDAIKEDAAKITEDDVKDADWDTDL